jgi:hypothetical protein
MLLTAHQANTLRAVNGAVGDTLFQSQRVEGAISVVAANPPWPAGSACGGTQDFCITADAVAATFVTGVVGDRRIGTSVYEGQAGAPGSSAINGWYPIEGVLPPELIQQGRNVVHKSGYKTGTTTGSIDLPVTQVISNIFWPIGSTTTRTVLFTNVTRVAQGGWGEGDSGGPVFAREVAGGPYYALGIQFGGVGTQNSAGQCNQGPVCKFFGASGNRVGVRQCFGSEIESAEMEVDRMAEAVAVAIAARAPLDGLDARVEALGPCIRCAGDDRVEDAPEVRPERLRRLLRRDFSGVGRRRIGTLMRHMGIAAVCPQPGTSRRHRAHPVFPYLLRHRTITRPNEVWAMDISVPQQAA